MDWIAYRLKRASSSRPTYPPAEVLLTSTRANHCTSPNFILCITVPGPRIEQEEKEACSKVAADPLEQDNTGEKPTPKPWNRAVDPKEPVVLSRVQLSYLRPRAAIFSQMCSKKL